MDELLAPNVACRFYGLAEVNGLEAFKQMAPAFAASFSDSWFTIETIIAEDDLVAIHYNWRATHCGEYLGVAATGKQVTETGTRFYRIIEGKIVEMWGDENVLGLLQQLGSEPQFG
jgi:predicted ester cyclase